jgi:hypothetical protein
MDSGDVPSAPTQALVHVDPKIRSGAYYYIGTGNGLDADKVDGYHATDLIAPSLYSEALVNGAMNVWQRGTSGSCPVGVRTYHADRWWTNPTGAAVTCARNTTTPFGAVARYVKLITGATSVTTCEIAGQRVESTLIPYIGSSVTISAFIKNDTGAALVVDLLLGTPAAQDDFTTVTNRLTTSLQSISSGSYARVLYTGTISGFTNLSNGLEVKFRSPSGSLDSVAKSISITEIQIDRSVSAQFFRFRPFEEDFIRCQRYYQKTFAYETVPAQNWAGAGSGLPAGSLAIPGSGVSTGADNTGVSWQFPQPMRATPAVVTFNPRAADTQARRIDDAASAAITVSAATSLVNFSISAANDRAHCFGATAEAEL